MLSNNSVSCSWSVVAILLKNFLAKRQVPFPTKFIPSAWRAPLRSLTRTLTCLLAITNTLVGSTHPTFTCLNKVLLTTDNGLWIRIAQRYLDIFFQLKTLLFDEMTHALRRQCLRRYQFQHIHRNSLISSSREFHRFRSA